MEQIHTNRTEVNKLPSIKDQCLSKEDSIINNITRWILDHKNIVPLGEEDPAADLLIQFLKSHKTRILKLKYRPVTIAAACIRLYSGQDTQIKATEEDLADYFKIRQKVLSCLVSKLGTEFLYFLLAKGCVLKFERGGHCRIVLAGTPIENLISVACTMMKRDRSKLVVVDEQSRVVDRVEPKQAFRVVTDKRKTRAKNGYLLIQ